jgi:hypothetical protein
MPTLNEFISAQNRNRYIGNAMKQKYTKIVQLVALAEGFKCNDIKYNVEVTWYITNRRSDPDNIASGLKFILDGLVKAKAIKNDGHKQIGSITHHFKDSETNYSVIKLIPINNK